jgi:hypothetical protein
MRKDTTRRLGNYVLTSRAMTRDDIPALHNLSIGVNWPHRPKDWEMLIDLGAGLVAEDEIGRVVGSAMCWRMEPDLALVGMVITTPRLQERGAGRWLMDELSVLIGSRDQLLNATRAALPLYLSLGFRPGLTVHQYQGVVIARPKVPAGARPMRLTDEPAIRALDASAFAAERGAVLGALLAVSSGTVLERGGAVAGFALCRAFGRGHVVGPVVAGSEADAVALIAPHAAAHAGAFLRVDTREPDGPLRRYVETCGLSVHETVTTMAKGRDRPPAGPAHIYGLASQSFG